MLIATVGLIGSGKDTVADYLVENYGYQRQSFAGSLKDAVAVVMGWDRELLEGRTKEAREWRETVDPWWAERLGIWNLTPRWVLQQWGTEVCRRHFHDDIWIASVEHKLLSRPPKVVISDCRFPNEVAAVRKANGLVIRVVRGEEPEWFPIAIEACQGNEEAKQELLNRSIHESEWAWANTDFDVVLTNNGTYRELYREVDVMLRLKSQEQGHLVSSPAYET
jgi:hypothetical protein